MKAAAITLTIITACSLLAGVFVWKKYDTEVLKNQEQTEQVQALEQTIKALQEDDIQRLIEQVRQVMAAEVLIADMDNPLWRYSYKEYNHPTMDSAEVYLKIREIIIEGDSGEIKADYTMLYYDSFGKLVMGSSAGGNFPVRWILGRQGHDWVITEIDEHP